MKELIKYKSTEGLRFYNRFLQQLKTKAVKTIHKNKSIEYLHFLQSDSATIENESN